MGHPALDQLSLTEVVDAGVARAAAVGVAAFGEDGWWSAVGAAGRAGRSLASPDTVFDLASVTKPFVALTFARLVQQGRLRYDTALGSLVPECRESPAGTCSLELLLSHRAGLLAHLPLYAPLESGKPVMRAEVLRLAAAARPAGLDPSRPAPPLYSDMGYLLSGEALSRCAGTPLDELVAREVCAPLGIAARSARQWLEHDASSVWRTAPTEHVAFRGGELRGVVHDENAWAFAGHGLAGQAGLFATVSDLLGLGRALVDGLAGRGTGWLDARTLGEIVRERPSGSLRLGFDGKSGPTPSAGPSASPAAFGHLGFTGTSLWCDPAAETVTVLLTNRVCPTRENTAIRSARPRVHEALFQLAASVTRRAVRGRSA